MGREKTVTCNFRFTVTSSQPNEKRFLDVSVNVERKEQLPRWRLDLGKNGSVGEPVTARGVRVSGTRSGTNWKKRKPNWFGWKEVTGVIDASETPVFQESTWNEDEEAMVGLVYSFGGKTLVPSRVSRSVTSSQSMPRKAGRTDCVRKDDFVQWIRRDHRRQLGRGEGKRNARCVKDREGFTPPRTE